MSEKTILSQFNHDLLKGARLELRDTARLEEFLQPFSKVGRDYVVRVVVAAKVGKKSFDDIMTELSRMWDERWKKGTPDRIGDPDDVAHPGVGAMNTGGFVIVRKNLGLPVPL